MSDERMFDPGPPIPPAFLAPVSAGRKRTIRQHEMLEQGVHPHAGGPVNTDETCGSCEYHGKQGGTSGTYHKCRRFPAKLTGGPATDIRVGWPACGMWEPIT